jgi:hypothetical protein
MKLSDIEKETVREYPAVRRQGRERTVSFIGPVPTPALVIEPSLFQWRDPTTIPPRQWLYARRLIRRYVSCTVAAPGLGKSSLEIVEAIAMVTGRSLFEHCPMSELRVWYFNGEDDPEEIERRVAAVMLRYEIQPEHLGDRLYYDSGRKTEIVVATIEKSAVKIVTPVVDAMISAIKRRKIDVLIIDPFVSSHRVGENDNHAIDAVVKTWARIADSTGCAIELVHHIRKTGAAEITVDDARGASALVAAARSVRVLNPMTEDEAAKAGVDSRRPYFRADNGKANLAPPPEKSEWFKLVSEPLGNGDEVGVVVPWQWPNALEGLSVAHLRKVQERLSDGEHAENVQAANWAGHAIGEVLEIDVSEPAGKARVKSLIKTWVANKVLRVEKKRSARDGRDKPMILVGELV